MRKDIGIYDAPDLSPEMAVRLSAVLGRSAESWMLLQDSYDLWKARQTVNTESMSRIDFSRDRIHGIL